ncbi:MAG: 1-acyl-sn-glycerol-3-phosphate acyltransferase [Frankiales bacterium]|nr:1-acyl-sn-glycerol-3-phosphate acyltransferase [Frankiales bacterium]
MRLRVLSTLFWAFVVASSLVLFPGAVLVWALTAPFGRRRVLLHLYTCFWASLYTWLNPLWPVQVRGREHVQRGATYVMVANHLSLLDILVMFRLFRHFTWVSKAENFKVPLVGWNMHLNAYIPLQRGDRESAATMLATAEADLRDGISVMIFPEGTRSRDGKLKPFKSGAFELATRTGLPVLPIAVAGTGDALPARGFVLRGRHPITLTVLPPIPAEGRDADELRDLARAAIEAQQAVSSV